MPAGQPITLNIPAILSITSGIIQSGQGNNGILRVANTAFDAVTFATTGSGYVDGPLQRGIVNSNQSYLFPLGKGGQFLPLMLQKPNVSGMNCLTKQELFLVR
jgi:hypothetical protein